MPATPCVSTRGSATQSYALITPENHVDNRLPGLVDVVARPLSTPRFGGARFGQYLLLFGPEGRSTMPQGVGFENFLFQLDGTLRVEMPEGQMTLEPGGFLFMPEGLSFSMTGEGAEAGTTLWTKRRYERVPGVPLPAPVHGHRSEAPHIVPAPPGSYTFQELLPAADPSYDMAMNILTAPPGGSIGLIEIHHQEHGLYMLDGGGIYHLAGDHHQVAAGDSIYMAPYCPQSFWATGPDGGSYLLYKDVNRDGF
jgi:(S)-ureidoglycine aminohydrolase